MRNNDNIFLGVVFVVFTGAVSVAVGAAAKLTDVKVEQIDRSLSMIIITCLSLGSSGVNAILGTVPCSAS